MIEDIALSELKLTIIKTIRYKLKHCQTKEMLKAIENEIISVYTTCQNKDIMEVCEKLLECDCKHFLKTKL